MGCNNANKTLLTRHRYLTAESIAVSLPPLVRRNTSPIRAPARPSRGMLSQVAFLWVMPKLILDLSCQVLLSVPPQ